MTQKQDATVTPDTIGAKVDPLDIYVSSDVLREAARLTKLVSKSRRSDYTINLLQVFLDVPLDSELVGIKAKELTFWLAEDAERRNLDPEVLYGKSWYQNLRILVRNGYLREPDEGYEYDLPILQTTAKGVAYLAWHKVLTHDDLLRMIVTGMSKATDFYAAPDSDTSHHYQTKYPIGNPRYYSAVLDKEHDDNRTDIHHLLAEDRDKYVRDLAVGVFNRDFRKVWKALETKVKVDFCEHMCAQFIEQPAVAKSYLKELMDHSSDPKAVLPALTALIGFTNPDDEEAAEAAIIDEVCRVGWALLKTAGNHVTGYTNAWVYESVEESSSRNFYQQIEEIKQQAAAVTSAITEATGLGPPRRPDYVIEMDDAQLMLDIKTKNKDLTDQQREELLERVTRAAAFIASGDIIDAMNDDDMNEAWAYFEDAMADAAHERSLDL